MKLLFCEEYIYKKKIYIPKKDIVADIPQVYSIIQLGVLQPVVPTDICLDQFEWGIETTITIGGILTIVLPLLTWS